MELNPRTFLFIPCSSHSLNLVANDATISSREKVKKKKNSSETVRVFLSVSIELGTPYYNI